MTMARAESYDTGCGARDPALAPPTVLRNGKAAHL
jgi:hypothetical protein